jgi:hypothetical protein
MLSDFSYINRASQISPNGLTKIVEMFTSSAFKQPASNYIQIIVEMYEHVEKEMQFKEVKNNK